MIANINNDCDSKKLQPHLQDFSDTPYKCIYLISSIKLLTLVWPLIWPWKQCLIGKIFVSFEGGSFVLKVCQMWCHSTHEKYWFYGFSIKSINSKWGIIFIIFTFDSLNDVLLAWHFVGLCSSLRSIKKRMIVCVTRFVQKLLSKNTK